MINFNAQMDELSHKIVSRPEKVGTVLTAITS
jgi:hypothetical protein